MKFSMWLGCKVTNMLLDFRKFIFAEFWKWCKRCENPKFLLKNYIPLILPSHSAPPVSSRSSPTPAQAFNPRCKLYIYSIDSLSTNN